MDNYRSFIAFVVIIGIIGSWFVVEFRALGKMEDKTAKDAAKYRLPWRAMSKTQRDAVLYRQARGHLLACVFNLVTSKLWTVGYDVMESLKPVRRPFGSSSVLDSPSLS